jgi:oxygen-independent coproporphyrinogen-3 oxidase
MTSLRTQWGCDLENIIQKFGKEISEKIKTEATIFVQKDWLIIKDEKLLLTKKGKLFADRIASELFQ